MVLGFNHNIMYRGQVFHVQTEDSGVEIPNIVTLLYQGGVIHCSIKTSYSDILKMDNLEQVVEELMKEQHKQVMRRLRAGEFDDRIFPGEKPPTADDVSLDDDSQDNAVATLESPQTVVEMDEPPPETPAEEAVEEVVEEAGEEGVSDTGADTTQRVESLDEAILSFFNITDV